MVELTDLDTKGIRPILEALEATGQLANTVIFFTSDNGYLHGEHRERKKDLPYWERTEVPFFVKGPGVRSGVSRRVRVNHTDLMLTACEIAGIRPASLDVDGRSMLPYLEAGTFFGWRKRMLVGGSDDVGPELTPGGSNCTAFPAFLDTYATRLLAAPLSLRFNHEEFWDGLYSVPKLLVVVSADSGALFERRVALGSAR